MKAYTFEAPAHWASAFINGDTSGLEPDDLAAFEAWCEAHKDETAEVVGCGEETWIGRFNGLQTEMLTYQALTRMHYLDISTVEARMITEPPRGRSRSGYGSKLPTAYLLQINKRWHRVYCICWSNSGTHYIVKGGRNLYIATGEI